MLRRPGPAADVQVPLSGFRMKLIAQVVASRPPPLEATRGYEISAQGLRRAPGLTAN